MLEGWPEYRAARLEAMEPRSPAQAAALARLKAAPQESYYMHGTYSVGKTHLMIAQYRPSPWPGFPAFCVPLGSSRTRCGRPKCRRRREWSRTNPR